MICHEHTVMHPLAVDVIVYVTGTPEVAPMSGGVFKSTIDADLLLAG